MGKYNYNQQSELDYTSNEEWRSDVSFHLHAIANELAETNRLKRIEINFSGRIPKDYLDEVLEDQA